MSHSESVAGEEHDANDQKRERQDSQPMRVHLCANSLSTARSGGVLLHPNCLSRTAAAHHVAQLEYDWFGAAVKDAVAGTLAADQTGVEENLQVLRYVGLTRFDGLDNLVHRHRLMLERLQNPQAAGISQNLESPGNHVYHLAMDHISLCMIGMHPASCWLHYIVI